MAVIRHDTKASVFAQLPFKLQADTAMQFNLKVPRRKPETKILGTLSVVSHAPESPDSSSPTLHCSAKVRRVSST
eukprot:scaffold61317_cov17-Tisochrysis_lutea.AAC.1